MEMIKSGKDGNEKKWRGREVSKKRKRDMERQIKNKREKIKACASETTSFYQAI